MPKIEEKRSCKERIEIELAGRISDFEKALKKDFSFQGDGYEYEDFSEFINSYALAFEDDLHYRGKRLELSYGGPQDYFIFFEDGSITYHFLDWFDGAEVELYGQNLEVMEAVRDYLTGSLYIEHIGEAQIIEYGGNLDYYYQDILKKRI